MEAFKVQFHASEQITAACAIIETAAKYEGGGLTFCSGSTQWSQQVLACLHVHTLKPL